MCVINLCFFPVMYVCAVSRFITSTLSLNYTDSYREVSMANEDDYTRRQGLTQFFIMKIVHITYLLIHKLTALPGCVCTRICILHYFIFNSQPSLAIR